MTGPLAGVRVLELAGVGAAPYGCMLLADQGAEVVRVERPGDSAMLPQSSPLLRNRRSVSIDLKAQAGRELLLAMATQADVLVEAFRPGVAERLGIGPEACLTRNQRLIYARMTGWGQSGPLAQTAGHDLNYIGLAGLLHQIGPPGGKPVVPLNVIGDFGGGGLLLAFGIVSALLETRRSGRGQVIDAAMLDGALSFMTMFFGEQASGRFDDRTGSHLLAGAAPYYDVYQTADGRALAVAPIEPQFYRRFLEKMGLTDARWLAAGFPACDRRTIAEEWPALKAELAARFRTRTREEWCALFTGSDVCVTPVLTLSEAGAHPHNRARQALVEVGGVPQSAPAPRFSRTPPSLPRPPPAAGADDAQVMADWAIAAELVERARRAGALSGRRDEGSAAPLP